MSTILLANNPGFTLFGIEIAWYGVILTFGMVCALVTFVLLSRKKFIEFDFAITMFLFAIVFATVGARLFYVLPRLDEFHSLWDMINISGGGLTIMGGIPCGALGIYLACRIYGKSIIRVLDIVVPCLFVGQIVGRWGNIVNQELYGAEITNEALQFFPFAMYIEKYDAWHAAIPFYEMMFNLLGLVLFLALMFKFKDKLKVGMFVGMYIVWYGLVRGILEIWKVGQLMWGDIGAIQLMCYILAPLGLILLLLIQFNIIKLETPKMYDKHFKVAYIPPLFVDGSDAVIEDIEQAGALKDDQNLQDTEQANPRGDNKAIGIHEDFIIIDEAMASDNEVFIRHRSSDYLRRKF